VNFMGWQRLAESLDSGGMAMLRVHECTHSTAFGAGEPKLLAVCCWLVSGARMRRVGKCQCLVRGLAR